MDHAQRHLAAAPRWTSRSRRNFSAPAGTAAINGNDGNNNVIWLAGTSWRYGSGTLGLTTTTFSSGNLLDADMELNDNSRWGTTGGANDTDLQSVVTHEAGHFIGFAHTTTGNAVMNPSIGSGVLKRTLLCAGPLGHLRRLPGDRGRAGLALLDRRDVHGRDRVRRRRGLHLAAVHAGLHRNGELPRGLLLPAVDRGLRVPAAGGRA